MAKERKNILINYIHDKNLTNFAENFLHGRLLDIGCGIKPYKSLLSPYVSEHIGLDHPETLHNKSHIDLFGTAYEIPEVSDTFDSVVCTAVLEHLEEPEKALRECFRVLKPGGVAIYSVPFIWHLHEEPRDFFRYSKYGLEYLFKKVGFEILELKPLSGFWVTFGQLLVYNLYRFNFGIFKLLKLVEALGLLIQVCAYGLDKIDKAERWTWMYMVAVKKPYKASQKQE